MKKLLLIPVMALASFCMLNGAELNSFNSLYSTFITTYVSAYSLKKTGPQKYPDHSTIEQLSETYGPFSNAYNNSLTEQNKHTLWAEANTEVSTMNIDLENLYWHKTGRTSLVGLALMSGAAVYYNYKYFDLKRLAGSAALCTAFLGGAGASFCNFPRIYRYYDELKKTRDTYQEKVLNPIKKSLTNPKGPENPEEQEDQEDPEEQENPEEQEDQEDPEEQENQEDQENQEKPTGPVCTHSSWFDCGWARLSSALYTALFR